MKKTLISIILIFVLLFSSVFCIPVSAYQINNYTMHHEAGLLVYLGSEKDEIIYSHNADKKMFPASITKLLTALVMLDNVDDLDNTKFTYTTSANNLILGTGSVVLNLKIGEELTARDALAALLVSSCGDVAYLIAENVGGTVAEFVDMMNKKAKKIGLKNSHFANPTGLHDDNHYMTANDIYTLAKKAFANKEIKKYASLSRAHISPTNKSEERVIVTSNGLINPNSDAYYRYAGAAKTGYTSEAGRCIVSLASYGGYDFLGVVLNAQAKPKRYDFADMANMFRWGFLNFEYKTVFADTTPIEEVPISLSSDTDHLPLCFDGGLKALLPKDADSSTLTYKITLDRSEFEAPIEKGTVVGTAKIFYAEEEIGTVNVVAAETVKSSGLLVFVDRIKNFFSSPFMVILYMVVGLVAAIFVIWIILLNTQKSKSRKPKVKYRPFSKKELREMEENAQKDES